jgi:glycosyltransferase involved in cell wall biosynthesis
MSLTRILLVSYTVPENRMGGGLLLHRHFTLGSPFDLGIITSNPSEPSIGGFCRLIREPAVLERLKRTRLATWFHDYTHLVHSRIPDSRLLRAAEEFQPDIILNVAETYLSRHALLLARKLGIPFACYFMDWAHYAAYTHSWAIPHMDRMFRHLYRECDLAFCISEGMKDELGPHANVRIVHPIPGIAPRLEIVAPTVGRAFTFLFAGNLAHWYGEQMQAIMSLCEDVPELALRVFGAYHHWDAAFEKRQTELGVYGGFRPFEELEGEFQTADAFLLPMGFDPASALIERTSFKTKFLDYLLHDKPIVVWGPEYCTAIQIARRYGCALCVTDPEPKAAIAGMRRLANDEALRNELTANGRKMLAGDFHRDRIAGELQAGLFGLLKSKGN